MTTWMVLAAARPWTYWLAPPLLMAGLLLILALAIEYYRTVAVPNARRQLLHEERRGAEQRSSDGMQRVHWGSPAEGQLQQPLAA
ncbi:MAG: hypothetical protein ACLGI3_16555 [Actinomycetes bacterium]